MHMHLLKYNGLIEVAIPTFDQLPDQMSVVTTVDSPQGIDMESIDSDLEEEVDYVNTIYDLFNRPDEYIEGDSTVIRDSALTAIYHGQVWWVEPHLPLKRRTATERNSSWTTIKFTNMNDVDDVVYAGSLRAGEHLKVKPAKVEVAYVREVEDSLRLASVRKAKELLTCLNPNIFNDYSAVIIRAVTMTSTEILDIRPEASTDLNYKEL